MFKKLVLSFLALAVVLSFSACKEKEDDQPKDDTVVEDEVENDAAAEDAEDDASAEEINYDDGLSDERYDGYEFRMFVRNGETHDQYFEEPQEDLVDDAIYRRNQAVMDKYGVTFKVTEAAGNWQTEALNSILAGDDAYDMILAHSRSAFSYATQGAVYNIHDIDAIHLDKPWWSKNVNDNCTVNGHLYVLDGDISLSGLASAMCLLFNKDIFDELGMDYPYDMVKEGAWTFDEFAYMAKKGGMDLNGDGVMKPEDDRYGFTTREWETPISILYIGGQKIYDKNEDGSLQLTIYSNKTVDVFDDFFSLMRNQNCFLQFTEGDINYNGPDFFENGRSMMTSGTLGSAQYYRNMDSDFGILPYPKYDESDEYTSIINGIAPLIVIPVTVSDVERTGSIIEALCAYGSKEVIPAFYEVSLKTKYARDEESEDMMDLIKDSIIYDLGYVAGGPFESCGRDMAKTGHPDFASFYAAKESAAESALVEFNRDYGGIE